MRSEAQDVCEDEVDHISFLSLLILLNSDVMARRYGFLYDKQRFAMLEAILGIQDVEEDICGDLVHMYRLEDATDSLLGTCCRLWQDTRGNIVNLIEWTNYDIVALSPTAQPHDRLGHGIFNGYSIRVRLDGSPCAMPPSHGAVFDPVVRYVLCFPEDAKHIHASTFQVGQPRRSPRLHVEKVFPRRATT
ncbi:unnamed protein product [Aphanomyces euteiches]